MDLASSQFIRNRVKSNRSNTKFTATSWIDQLDPADFAAAREEALVDAYGHYEQHIGFITALGDELALLSKAKVMGDADAIVAAWDEAVVDAEQPKEGWALGLMDARSDLSQVGLLVEETSLIAGELAQVNV